MRAVGYVRARCVEDYTQLTRRSSEDGALSDTGREAAAAGPAESRRKVTPPAPAESRKPVSPPLSATHQPNTDVPPKKTISFSSVIQEDDEEEEEDDDNMAELYKHLGRQSEVHFFGSIILNY